jgi:exodeoxyribonuclease V alpha subunit
VSFTLPDLALADPERDAALCGPLDDLAAGFGATLAQLHVSLGGDPADAPRVAALGAAVSLAVSEGHACLPLNAVRDTGEDSTPAAVRTALAKSPVVLIDPAIGLDTPREALIIDRNRLYLQRYWRYETRLARLLAAIDQAMPIASDDLVELALDDVFDAAKGQADWQRVAARTALRRRLAVITGGPGTGKTRTVARLLAALTRIKPDARIALAAPTGKAALRLEQSVKEQLAALGVGGDRAALADIKALTVHSLLGARYGGVSFKHDNRRPLPHDVVVIDEASMLDLALATKLLDALSAHARLVLLGDADQLASVETGAVFAEISSLGGIGADEPRDLFTPSAPLADAVVELKVSYRYQSGGVIGRFADAVRTGEVPLALSLLGVDPKTLSLHSTEGAASELIDHLLAGFDPFLAAVQESLNPLAVLKVLERYRVLCALRQGPSEVLPSTLRLNVPWPDDWGSSMALSGLPDGP